MKISRIRIRNLLGITERLDTADRERLYQKCRDKGIQMIASRVTDSEEMEVIEL